MVGGGTAGHVLPTIPIIEKLKQSDCMVFFIGTRSGLEEELLEGVDVDFIPIPTGKLRRYFSIKNVVDFFGFCFGVVYSLFLIAKIKPEVIFSKGGFVALPVVLAGWMLRVPILAHESDRTPGLANRISMRFLSTYCTSFPSADSFPKNFRHVHTGSPLRAEIENGDVARGKEVLSYVDKKPILVVTGGSLGSKIINQNVRAVLDELLLSFNVLHVCGQGNLMPISKNGYKQIEYVSENWGHILAAADLVITRAGANALFELLAIRKVCIFIPLSKKVSRGDQIDNSHYVIENNFGKVLFEDSLTSESLLEAISSTYRARELFSQSLENFRPLDASTIIYDEILDLVAR